LATWREDYPIPKVLDLGTICASRENVQLQEYKLREKLLDRTPVMVHL
jgi:hypothetical protein